MKIRVLGIVFGTIAGIFLGSGTGIVGGGGGVSGVYVFACLGAVLGFFAAPDVAKTWNKLRRK